MDSTNPAPPPEFVIAAETVLIPTFIFAVKEDPVPVHPLADETAKIPLTVTAA
jgi:hypothetical protein